MFVLPFALRWDVAEFALAALVGGAEVEIADGGDLLRVQQEIRSVFEVLVRSGLYSIKVLAAQDRLEARQHAFEVGVYGRFAAAMKEHDLAAMTVIGLRDAAPLCLRAKYKGRTKYKRLMKSNPIVLLHQLKKETAAIFSLIADLSALRADNIRAVEVQLMQGDVLKALCSEELSSLLVALTHLNVNADAALPLMPRIRQVDELERIVLFLKCSEEHKDEELASCIEDSCRSVQHAVQVVRERQAQLFHLLRAILDAVSPKGVNDCHTPSGTALTIRAMALILPVLSIGTQQFFVHHIFSCDYPHLQFLLQALSSVPKLSLSRAVCLCYEYARNRNDTEREWERSFEQHQKAEILQRTLVQQALMRYNIVKEEMDALMIVRWEHVRNERDMEMASLRRLEASERAQVKYNDEFAKRQLAEEGCTDFEVERGNWLALLKTTVLSSEKKIAELLKKAGKKDGEVGSATNGLANGGPPPRSTSGGENGGASHTAVCDSSQALPTESPPKQICEFRHRLILFCADGFGGSTLPHVLGLPQLKLPCDVATVTVRDLSELRDALQREEPLLCCENCIRFLFVCQSLQELQPVFDRLLRDDDAFMQLNQSCCLIFTTKASSGVPPWGLLFPCTSSRERAAAFATCFELSVTPLISTFFPDGAELQHAGLPWRCVPDASGASGATFCKYYVAPPRHTDDTVSAQLFHLARRMISRTLPGGPKQRFSLRRAILVQNDALLANFCSCVRDATMQRIRRFPECAASFELSKGRADPRDDVLRVPSLCIPQLDFLKQLGVQISLLLHITDDETEGKICREGFKAAARTSQGGIVFSGFPEAALRKCRRRTSPMAVATRAAILSWVIIDPAAARTSFTYSLDKSATCDDDDGHYAMARRGKGDAGALPDGDEYVCFDAALAYPLCVLELD